MKKYTIGLSALLLTLVLTGCGKTTDNTTTTTTTSTTTTTTTTTTVAAQATPTGTIITLEEYNKVTTGMSYAQLKEIVGGDCTKELDQDVAGMHQAAYSCQGQDANSAAIFTFQNDSLVNKIQNGLK